MEILCEGEMMQVEVSTKEDLKCAYKARVDTIVVVGELAKKMKKVEPIRKVKPIALGGLGLLAGASVMGGPFGSFSAASIAAMTGLEIGIVVIATSIGLSLIISLFRDYETEMSVELGADTVKYTLKRKR